MAADGSARVQSHGRALPVDDTARTTKELAASIVSDPSDVSSGFAILDRDLPGLGLLALASELVIRLATPFRERSASGPHLCLVQRTSASFSSVDESGPAVR